MSTVPDTFSPAHTLLALNPGSATLKFAQFRTTPNADSITEFPIAEGTVERIGQAGHPATPADAFRELLEGWQDQQQPVPDAIVCRVVMGGETLREATRVTPEVIEAIRALEPLAPLHNPPARETLEVCQTLLPDVSLFAVFDTAFHRTLPEVAFTYGLPRLLCQQYGLRRYGFHGLAHQWVSSRLYERLTEQQKPAERLITCHLGSGASVCAILHGQSIDTSMGFTPLEGLVMGTRSGDVDPGLLLHLQKTLGYSPDDLERLLNRESGLLGVSGISNDVRDLEAQAQVGNPPAKLALDLFAYRVAKTIGAYYVALEGVDAIAFSGGIGENGAAMRERICRRLKPIGVILDSERNSRAVPPDVGTLCLSSHESPVSVWAIRADENRQMLEEIRSFLLKLSL